MIKRKNIKKDIEGFDGKITHKFVCVCRSPWNYSETEFLFRAEKYTRSSLGHVIILFIIVEWLTSYNKQ